MKAHDIHIGDIVFVSDEKDATEWEVISKQGFDVELREKGTHFASQWLDCCYIKRRKL